MKVSFVCIATLALFLVVHPAFGQTPSSESATPPQAASPETSFKNSLSLGIAVPLTGGMNLGWGRPVSNRLVLASFINYFDRDWMLIIEPSDWHSYSGYIGVSLQYYPTGAPGSYGGYFIGGDTGLAISYQTYNPTSESDVFFFPFIDLYFFGYDFRIWRGLYLSMILGGGYAPVGPIVRVNEHRHSGGDFYPFADVRVCYRW